MTNNKNHLRLDEGIFFEDTHSIIRWNTRFSDLGKIDNPAIIKDGKWLIWKNKSCFNGLILNVSVKQDENFKLKEIHFGNENKNARELYKQRVEHFTKLIGKPSEIKKYLYGVPIAIWKLKNIEIFIGIGERFVEYPIFIIRYNKKITF